MTGTLGIIAGNGTLPIEIAEGAVGRGQGVFVVGIDAEADAAIARFPHARLDWGRFGNLFALLERNGVHDVVFAGGVRRRPKLGPKHLDWETVKTLPSLLTLLMSGDDTILAGVAGLFERRGFRMVGVREAAPDLLLTAGDAVGRLSARSREQAELGARIVRALGPFDVGQGVVVCGRRAVAVEGLEGTDAMLRRVEELRDTGRLADGVDGVLVKVPKPEQDRRMDLPAIGPRTVINARAAGLRAVVGEGGGAVVLERERTFDLARRHRVAVHGLLA